MLNLIDTRSCLSKILQTRAIVIRLEKISKTKLILYPYVMTIYQTRIDFSVHRLLVFSLWKLELPKNCTVLTSCLSYIIEI